MTGYFVAPDVVDVPTLWSGSPDDLAPEAVINRYELRGYPEVWAALETWAASSSDAAGRGERQRAEAVEKAAAVLDVHTYVIDGPPAVIGVRCPCGFRQAAPSPEAASHLARTHVAAALLASGALASPAEAERLPNACARCGDCFHPRFGPNTDGDPCEWCRDCGCAQSEHDPAEAETAVAVDGSLTEEDARDLTHAILRHYGHTPEQIDAAENVHPGRACDNDSCYDEDGASVHGSTHTDLWQTADVIVDVVLPWLAQRTAAAKAEAWEDGYMACQDGKQQQADNPYRADRLAAEGES